MRFANEAGSSLGPVGDGVRNGSSGFEDLADLECKLKTNRPIEQQISQPTSQPTTQPANRPAANQPINEAVKSASQQLLTPPKPASQPASQPAKRMQLGNRPPAVPTLQNMCFSCTVTPAANLPNMCFSCTVTPALLAAPPPA